MRPIGPGRLGDFAGELSTGFQDWTLRHHHVATVNEWCVLVYPAAGPSFDAQFVRGDADRNGVLFAIVDALYVLTYRFLDGPAPPGLDAADVDDNDSISPLLDGLYLLTYAFLGGPAPPALGAYTCGSDPPTIPSNASSRRPAAARAPGVEPLSSTAAHPLPRGAFVCQRACTEGRQSPPPGFQARMMSD